MTTIVTLALDADSQAHLDALRKRHYPVALNQIAAHVTLFHTLPQLDRVRDVLQEVVARRVAFEVEVTGLRSLGRGVAYTLASPELVRMHKELSRSFAEWLTPQDRQKFQPHVVVQNKVSAVDAKALLDEMCAEFVSFPVQAEGLVWWEYLGGPWSQIARFAFGVDPATQG